MEVRQNISLTHQNIVMSSKVFHSSQLILYYIRHEWIVLKINFLKIFFCHFINFQNNIYVFIRIITNIDI
jgi:hypothetical protein